MKKVIILFAALVMASCMQAPQTDLEGLKSMRNAWDSAYSAGDAAALAEIYEEDGALMPPNGTPISGRADIEAFWGDFMASGGAVIITDAEAYAHGDVGYKSGTYMVTDSGGASVDEGKYVEVWRHTDGRWQMHRDIWNSNLPLAEEAEEVVEAE